MQPNFYTILKKMNMAEMLIFVVCSNYKKYPIGHQIKIFNPAKYDKAWYGLIKCKVLAPEKLYHPVLAQRTKVDNYQKLIFTLCKTCAETKNQNNCTHHNYEDRLLELGQQMK